MASLVATINLIYLRMARPSLLAYAFSIAGMAIPFEMSIPSESNFFLRTWRGGIRFEGWIGHMNPVQELDLIVFRGVFRSPVG